MANPDKTADEEIRHNIEAHNRVGAEYNDRHGEIFDPVEQGRLAKELAGLEEASTSGGRRALDYGCGTGNLTRHLLQLGWEVTAADVSSKFLELVESSFADAGVLKTLQLNGRDLTGLDDAQYDLVATYSVLHHIPDYLAAVADMVRVLRPGGLLYIDHEVNQTYWERPTVYQEYRAQVRKQRKRSWFRPEKLLRRLFGRPVSAANNEGDIHVYSDDHIEWDRIVTVLKEQGCELLKEEDYLLARYGVPHHIYESFCHQITDYRLLLARKV